VVQKRSLGFSETEQPPFGENVAEFISGHMFLFREFIGKVLQIKVILRLPL